MSDVLFEPLSFRNLTVKNRVFRSNISGRFDNYDGSGNQARINWEVKFASGGVGAIISSFVPVHPRGRIMPNYATIDQRRPDPVLARGRRGGARARLQVHHAAQPRRPPARRARTSSIPKGQSSTDTKDPLHGFECERMTIGDIREDGRGVRRGRAARARGRARRRRAARRQRLSHHAVPELGDQRPQGRIRRLAREPRALRPRDRARDPRDGRPRLPPADEDQRDRAQQRAVRR